LIKIEVETSLFVFTSLVLRSIDVGHSVLAHFLFKKVGFALEGDHLHPFERVGYMIEFGVTKGVKEMVCYKFNVLGHQGAVHAYKFNGKALSDEAIFDLYCF
jgi:hypothetical protein